MARFVLRIVALIGTLFLQYALTQSGAVIPQGGAGHAPGASCVILKRMGPADEVTSHLYSFGLRGKQFQYVEGKLPEGFPFHGRLTDHDVRNLQGRGAEVIVLEPHYTADDLKQARADCRGETGKSPNQSEAKSAPTPSDSRGANLAPSVTSSNGSGGKMSLTSSPAGADIEIDTSFVGDTPSDVQVPEGEHTVTVKKAGYKTWERKLKVSGGSSVHISVELEKVDSQ